MPPLLGIDGRSNDIPMFRCGKGTTFEGGMRVPGVISLRSTLKPATTPAVFSHMDILPLSILHPVTTRYTRHNRDQFCATWMGPRPRLWTTCCHVARTRVSSTTRTPPSPRSARTPSGVELQTNLREDYADLCVSVPISCLLTLG